MHFTAIHHSRYTHPRNNLKSETSPVGSTPRVNAYATNAGASGWLDLLSTHAILETNQHCCVEPKKLDLGTEKSQDRYHLTSKRTNAKITQRNSTESVCFIQCTYVHTYNRLRYCLYYAKYVLTEEATTLKG
jgi:hypothetical protein